MYFPTPIQLCGVHQFKTHVVCFAPINQWPQSPQGCHVADSVARSPVHSPTILPPLLLEFRLRTGRGRQPDNKYKELKPYQTSLHDVFQTIIGLTPKVLLAIVLLPSFMAPLESGWVCVFVRSYSRLNRVRICFT